MSAYSLQWVFCRATEGWAWQSPVRNQPQHVFFIFCLFQMYLFLVAVGVPEDTNFVFVLTNQWKYSVVCRKLV
jgi:hypothetical protein